MMSSEKGSGEEKPLISVIIPVYCVEKYLDLCLETVTHQTYSNLDIILVDDGSPDSCPKMCDHWAQRDNRISVIHKTNGGLSDARNCGLRRARGEYIAFVDSDDWISLVMIEKMWEAMKQYDADMAVCQFIHIYEDGRSEKSTKETFPVEVLDSKEALALLLEDRRITSHVWRKLYRRDRIGTDPFPVGKDYEDIDATYRLFQSCSKIVCINEAYYYYRHNPSGIVARNTVKSLTDRLESVLTRHQILSDCLPGMERALERAKNRELYLIWENLPAKSEKQDKEVWKRCRAKIRRELSGKRPDGISGVRRQMDFLLIGRLPWAEKLCYRLFLSKNSPFSLLIRRGKTALQNIGYLRKAGRGKRKRKRFYVFAVPTYGNLGDRALLFAEKAFVKDYFPDCQFYPIPLERTIGVPKRMLSWLVRSGDYCTLHAGGNIGTLYPGIHRGQERILDALHRKNITIFPQTYYYEEDEAGRKALESSQKLYRRCVGLRICTRDQTSFAYVRANFPKTESLLAPDMALYLPAWKGDGHRKGALVCIRRDGEKRMTDALYGKILDLLQERFGVVEDCDTHVHMSLTEEQARDELEKLWTRMAGSQILITDRLHGMIFSALTQTPCVVFPCKSHKTAGVYDRIRTLGYIKLINGESELEEAVRQVTSVLFPVYEPEAWKEDFTRIAETIRENIPGRISR